MNKSLFIQIMKNVKYFPNIFLFREKNLKKMKEFYLCVQKKSFEILEMKCTFD